MIWDTTFRADEALDLPSGKLGELVGAIVLERDFSRQEVLDAASFLIEQCWADQFDTQADLLVTAQTLGHGLQSPALWVMRYRPRPTEAALDRLKEAQRKLAGVQTADEQQLVQAEVDQARNEFDRLMAEQQAEIDRLKAQVPQAN